MADFIGVRLTSAQYQWVESEANRLDRPKSWILRKLVAKEMDEPKPRRYERPRTTPSQS